MCLMIEIEIDCNVWAFVKHWHWKVSVYICRYVDVVICTRGRNLSSVNCPDNIIHVRIFTEHIRHKSVTLRVRQRHKVRVYKINIVFLVGFDIRFWLFFWSQSVGNGLWHFSFGAVYPVYVFNVDSDIWSVKLVIWRP
jgi:hypothetical protein